jgi:hypothetical protein
MADYVKIVKDTTNVIVTNPNEVGLGFGEIEDKRIFCISLEDGKWFGLTEECALALLELLESSDLKNRPELKESLEHLTWKDFPGSFNCSCKECQKNES